MTIINKIYADSLEHPTWTWDTIYDKLKVVVDDMSDGINPGGYRDRDRPDRCSENGQRRHEQADPSVEETAAALLHPRPRIKKSARTAKGPMDRGSALTKGASGPAATVSSSPPPRNVRNTSSPTTEKMNNRKDHPTTPAETEAEAEAEAVEKTPPRQVFTAPSLGQAKTSHTPLTQIPTQIDSYHSPRRVAPRGS
jgi:hypothetical protein